jgi:hypothetical protein
MHVSVLLVPSKRSYLGEDDWQEHIFGISAHQDDKTKEKQCRAPNHQYVAQCHFIHQSSFSFGRRHFWTFLIHSVIFTLSPDEHRYTQRARQIPSLQATSHLQQKAMRNQNAIPSATRLLPPCTSFYFLPPKPLKFLLSACSWIPASLCFPITLTNAAAPIPFP